MKPLWHARDAVIATGGQCDHDWIARGVSIDTRDLKPGDLFVALRANRDGHDFVEDALKKGACAALVTHSPKGLAPDAPLLIVKDVQSALENLARAARARARAKVIGVTGSAGKTSTKNMLRVMLEALGKTHAAKKSFNNHWGVPLTLANLPPDAEFAVIEIGMNAPGEIAPLSALAKPHIALITTVAPAHFAAFCSVEEIAAEKAEIFSGLPADGIAIFPNDLAVSDMLANAAQKKSAHSISFGKPAPSAVSITKIEDCNGKQSIRFSGQFSGHFQINTLAPHFAKDALAALIAIHALGLNTSLATRTLENWSPEKGRGATRQITLPSPQKGLPPCSFHLIDDAYNANPASVAAALEMLAKAPGRKLAFLGDMLELGPTSADFHRALAALPAISAIDQIHVAGTLMKALWQALPPKKRGKFTKTSAELAREAKELIQPGDTVLVKGSFGSKMTNVIDALERLGLSEGEFNKGDD